MRFVTFNVLRQCSLSRQIAESPAIKWRIYMILKVFSEHDVSIVVMKIIAFLILQGPGLHLFFSKPALPSNTQKIQKTGDLCLFLWGSLKKNPPVLIYFISHIYMPCIIYVIYVPSIIMFHIYHIYCVCSTYCICHEWLYNLWFLSSYCHI